MNLLHTLSCLVFFFIPGPGLFSQQTISAAGGEAAGISGTVSYTIGQVDFITLDKPAGWINLGVQQPQPKPGAGPDVRIPCLVYPNPTSGNLRVSTTDPGFQSFSYTLYDFQGRLVRQEKDVAVADAIHIGDLAEGIYLISIENNRGQIWDCRVIKILP